MRTDRAYWARLRKDPRSNWSAGLAVLAGLAAVVAMMGHVFTGAPGVVRLDPLYWLALAPFAWWGASLASFERWAVRLMLPVAIISPILCLVSAVIAQADEKTLNIIAFIVASVAAIGAVVLYRGSLLHVEGPSR